MRKTEWSNLERNGTMAKVEIDVDQVIVSAVSLDLDPGDKVLVMNGVIVGIMEKKRKLQIEPPELRPAPKLDKIVVTNNAIIRNEIMQLLEDRELTAYQIGKELESSYDGQRISIGPLLKLMRDQKFIVAVNPEKRKPLYRLAK
jgi:hypothetical protein